MTLYSFQYPPFWADNQMMVRGEGASANILANSETKEGFIFINWVEGSDMCAFLEKVSSTLEKYEFFRGEET